jgi:hypothetical protein
MSKKRKKYNSQLQRRVEGREERVRQLSAGSASQVRGPFTTGRVNNNLVSGEPGALHDRIMQIIKKIDI